MKHTILKVKTKIEKEIEVSIERDQVIELRHGDDHVWELGYVVSIFELVLFNKLMLFVLVRVNGYADHAYPLANLKEDHGSLYFYEGETL